MYQATFKNKEIYFSKTKWRETVYYHDYTIITLLETQQKDMIKEEIDDSMRWWDLMKCNMIQIIKYIELYSLAFYYIALW